jgi:predicted nucleic acid-binding protein
MAELERLAARPTRDEFLLQTPLGVRVEARVFRHEDEPHAPHLVDVEVAQGQRHAHLDLLTRAWKLRENLTAYDAMYVALAEALDAPIVTCDTPLARAPGHRARIEAIE